MSLSGFEAKCQDSREARKAKLQSWTRHNESPQKRSQLQTSLCTRRITVDVTEIVDCGTTFGNDHQVTITCFFA